ncbi:MAG: hypothetical protein CENE_01684 [Candidatus Celerinatantimonas neptuna]|nr:MAG: hypothetical protein CENE_01684 [Candidatus Celerinatantimonas neptuna]
MRLGRRGWNNVIIFVVLAMILLFRFTSEKLNEHRSEPASSVQASSSSLANQGRLLPSDAVVLELDLPGRVIQRVGTGWRSQPEASRSVVTVDAWLHIQLPRWKKAIGGTVEGQVIRVYLANRADPLQLTLFHFKDQYYITNWQGQLLKLDQTSYNALFSRNP